GPRSPVVGRPPAIAAAEDFRRSHSRIDGRVGDIAQPVIAAQFRASFDRQGVMALAFGKPRLDRFCDLDAQVAPRAGLEARRDLTLALCAEGMVEHQALELSGEFGLVAQLEIESELAASLRQR